MENVQPLVAAVKPVIQDAISSQSVTPILNSAVASPAYATTRTSASSLIEKVAWLWYDKRAWWLVGGIAVGFYFGFRVGVVSGRCVRP